MKTKLVGILVSMILFLSMLTLALNTHPAISDPGIINVPSPGISTIQAAINAANPGDTIVVAAGTYNEEVVIDKALTILGAGADKTFINGTDVTLASAGLVKTTAAGNVKFSGFTVENAPLDPSLTAFGILSESSVSGVTYTISNNSIIGTGDTNPLDFECGFCSQSDAANVVFKYNNITSMGGNNICFEKHTGATEISHNNLGAGIGGGDAIFFMTYAGHDVSALQNVSYNTIDMGRGTTFTYDYRATGITFGAPGYGIGDAQYINVLIEGNTIYNLQSYRRGIGFWIGGPGSHITSPVVTGNTITGVGSPVGSYGIYFVGSGDVAGATLTLNTITGTEYAIYLRSGDASGAKINYNNIAGNTIGLDWTGGSLADARFNWWGSATGPNPPGAGEPVTGNADTSHWLISPFQQERLYTSPKPVSKVYGDVGANFDLDVKIANITDLYGFDVKLTWNNSLITLKHDNYASAFNALWGSGNWWLSENLSGVSGGMGYYRIIVVAQVPAVGFTGSHTLFTLTFHIVTGSNIATLQTPIHFEIAKLSNSLYTSIPATVEDGLYHMARALSVSITPSSVVMGIGASELFTSNVSGGISPYYYQWYLDGFAVSGITNVSWAFVPTSVGSYTVYLNVTDNLGEVAISNTATVAVYGVLSVSVSPVSVVQGVFQSQLFTSRVSGGTSPYSYQWYLNGTAQPSATSVTWTFPPSSPGIYTVYVVVTDGFGAQATSNVATVTVYLRYVAVTNFRVSKTLVGQGFSDSINVTVINQGSYIETFQVTVYANTTSIASQTITLSIGQSNTTTFVWDTTSFAMGSYTITALVTLAPSETNTAPSTYTYGIVKVGALSVGISPGSVVLDVGQSKSFVLTVFQGTPSYSYQWYLNGSTVSGATSPTWNFTALSAGSYKVYVEVTDSLGLVAKSNTATITVHGALSVSVSPVSVVQSVFQSQLFTSNVSGGTSAYNYQWYLNGTAQPGAASTTWNFTVSSAGYYTVYVVVTDGVGVRATSNVATVRRASVPWSTGGVVGITGYKLVFNGTFGNFFSSNTTIDYYWSFSIDKWSGTQWVASGISGSSATVTGYVIPSLTTVDLPYYIYLLPQSGSNAVAWGDWLRISYTFHWTYSSTNYSTDYVAKVHVHPADIAGAASVVFPLLGADGKVGTADLHVLGVQWGSSSVGADPTSDLGRADINGDGNVGTADLHILGVEWGWTWTNTAPPG